MMCVVLNEPKTRWKGKGNSNIKVGDYDFLCSGGQKHSLGVGFAIHKNLRNKSLELLPIIGKESLHTESNNNGTRVIDASKSMMVASTYFPRKGTHKQTWKSPDGITINNQIDHVLIERRGISSILQVRTYRKPNIDSDHFLVGIRYRCRILNRKTKAHNRCKKFNVEELRNPNKLEGYQSKLLEELNRVTNEEQTVENNWRNIQNAIKRSAEEVLGYQERAKKNTWYDEECRTAIERKNTLRMQWLSRPTRRREIEYKIARNEAKKICRKKKRSFNNDHIIRMQENIQKQDIRKAYRELNVFRRGFIPIANMCRDLNGTIIVGKEEVNNRWREYFQ